MKALITRKLGMTSTMAEDGVMTAITLLSVAPNVVTQIKNTESDGYDAIQLGTNKTKNIAKPLVGHLKKSKSQVKVLREFRINNQVSEEISVGTEIVADTFTIGDMVHVTGMSKGKGWGGTIKRHGFHRGRKTHGGGSYRRPGSIGSMYPQKIFKGKKMAGQLGYDRVTIQNLKVVVVDPDLQVIGVMGAVPGPKKGIVLVRGAE